jgi:DNA modification methylase
LLAFSVIQRTGIRNQVKDIDTALQTLENCAREVAQSDRDLLRHFQAQWYIEPALARSLVSFQANKTKPKYRWYKYKEAFSATLVEYLLQKYQINGGKILDPFAGSGTALFAASAADIDAEGLELLPIAQQIIQTRILLERDFKAEDIACLKARSLVPFWQASDTQIPLPELRITKDAYPPETKVAIEQYLSATQRENERVKTVLNFALLCVLESISYTRKDGQYLRWDYRAKRGRSQTQFKKGKILDFEHAIALKLLEIIEDIESETNAISRVNPQNKPGKIQLHCGSSLQILPLLSENDYDGIITSPPYCNRYDYTRTYALELALLNLDEAELVKLRQEMLSCTVENRNKNLLKINASWQEALSVVKNQELLQLILKYLDFSQKQGKLNNAGIPRMVRGYFYEMACLIQECYRILKPQSRLLMINDNVRYAGASISVDAILSDIAEKLGFVVENILVLPSSKGNSSQQMRDRGREPLRKCVYVWKKP